MLVKRFYAYGSAVMTPAVVGGKVNVCPRCGKKFESLSGLRTHLRDRHQGYYLTRFVAPWIALLAIAAAAAATLLPTHPPTPASLTTDEELVFEIYHSPQCGCCGEYVKYLKSMGVEVRLTLTEDVDKIKKRLNIPSQMWSCHTSVVGGYFVEGHVPLEAVRKLLSERPAVDGIALLGMPAGSPGMGGVKTKPFTIYSVVDGTTSTFMHL